MGKSRKNSRAARNKDKLRKQKERLQVIESFVYCQTINEWKNDKITKLNIPSPLHRTSNDNIQSLPLADPIAVHQINPDGNCLFSALSYVLTGTQNYHHNVRLAICDFMKSNTDEFEVNLPPCINDVQTYLNNTQMEVTGTWGTELEIIAASILLQTNIFVYSKEGRQWTWIKHSPPNITVNHGLYLYHKDANHFEVVVAVENSDIPSLITSDQFYNPKVNQHSIAKKRKLETKQKRMNKRYKYDETFANNKKKSVKKRYIQHKNYRNNKLKSANDKYNQDKIFRSTRKQYAKKKYNLDKSYRYKKRMASIAKYSTNALFRLSIQQASKKKYAVDCQKIKSYSKMKYWRDPSYRQKRKDSSKGKYVTDHLHRQKLQDSSKAKYATDPLHRQNLKDSSKAKYATDPLHRQKLKDSSKAKYATDPLHRQNLKDSSKAKYATDLLHRQKLKDSSKAKYATDPLHRQKLETRYSNDASYREKQIDYEKTRYSNDPLYRQKHKDSSKAKYATDPLHRYQVREYSKSKYHRLSSFQNKVKASSIKKYGSNPLFRLRLKNLLRKTYNQSYSTRQLKKLRVKTARKSVSISIRNFKKSVNNLPKYICRVCIRLLYRNQVKKFTEKRYFVKDEGRLNEMAEKCFTATFSHVCDNNICLKNCWMKILQNDKNWICHTCDKHLKQGGMPPQAQANNLFLIPVPTELSKLNVLERQLIALRIPFMKLLSLPRGGQKGVKGPVVNGHLIYLM